MMLRYVDVLLQKTHISKGTASARADQFDLQLPQPWILIIIMLSATSGADIRTSPNLTGRPLLRVPADAFRREVNAH
jgi:hypothetical protein